MQFLVVLDLHWVAASLAISSLVIVGLARMSVWQTLAIRPLPAWFFFKYFAMIPSPSPIKKYFLIDIEDYIIWNFKKILSRCK